MRVLTPLLCLGFALGACVAGPTLVSKSAVVPDGVDFTGMWQLRNGSGVERRSDNAASREDLIVLDRDADPRRGRSKSNRSVQVFIEYGESLKITQTRYGLFISYDRSVVEEFTFGENREVTIGPIEAMRASGWEGDSLVIETLDDAGSILSESWRFEGSKDVLVRNIRITKGDTEIFSRRQVFDRI